MLNIINTTFSSIEVWFTDQSSEPLDVEDSVKITLIIDIIKMRCSVESKYKKYAKGYGVLSFAKKYGDKYGKKLMDTATKTGIDDSKTASKRVVQKTEQAKGDLAGIKIAYTITSSGKTKYRKRRGKTRNLHITRKKMGNY